MGDSVFWILAGFWVFDDGSLDRRGSPERTASMDFTIPSAGSFFVGTLQVGDSSEHN